MIIYGCSLCLIASVSFYQPSEEMYTSAHRGDKKPAARIRLLFVKGTVEDVKLKDRLETELSELARHLRYAERLTVEKYRSVGVEVVESESSEVEDWISRFAEEMKDAVWDFKLLAYCDANAFDVVGGLKISESISGEGFVYWGWVINLRRMTRSIALYGMHSAPVELLDVLDKRGPDRVLSLLPRPPSRKQWSFASDVRNRPYKQLPCPQLSRRPFLGIAWEEQDGENARPGACVMDVLQFSPAEACGLRRDDIITVIDGINAIEMFNGTLAREYVPGTEITIDAIRAGQPYSCRAHLIAEGEYYQQLARTSAKDWVKRWVKQGANNDIQRACDTEPRVFVLYFWGFFDGEPSLIHLPILHLLWQRYQQDGLVWVNVNCDPDIEDSKWQEYIRANGLGGIQISSPAIATRFAIDEFPSVLLLAGDGTVLEKVRPKDLTIAVVQLMSRIGSDPNSP